MKLRTSFCCTLLCCLASVAAHAQNRPASADIPHLQKQGASTQLIVDGKPYLALAGELNNDSATSLEYMRHVWPRLVEAKINTVLAGVSWNQIERQEGKFDFSVLDGVIRGARSNNLRLVLLWFASWKNSTSSYPPDWVKKDFERFPRAQTKAGKSVELITPLSDANRDADAKAFAALMRHVKEVDSQEHTVLMVQVENEVGMQGDSRDFSPLANKAFAGPVPKELMDYLQQHKDTLVPEFRQVWEAGGFKTSGTWEEVFGKSAVTDGYFMAWNYARYIGRVVEAGKAELPIPMFVNAALYGIGRGTQQPASGGRPWDLVMDIWKAGAPRLDMLSPDNYGNFVEFCAKYARPDNPLFIPEALNQAVGAGRVLYAVGRHDAIGFSAMGAVERSNTPDTDLIESYNILTQLTPLILQHQGNGTMSAVLMAPDDPPQKIKVGNYILEATFMKPRTAPLTQPTPIPPNTFGSAIFIATGPDEYYVAGSGIILTFSPATPGPPVAGLATVEEGSFVNGRWVPGRLEAGDSTDEGQSIRIAWAPGSWVPVYRQRSSPDAIQRVTLYRYR
ncbi:MAG: DUF5597 domain-containing protein [Bryobacteraceae bacterium]